MFGFVIGTACLVGLIKVIRHGGGCGWGHAHWRGGGMGGGCHQQERWGGGQGRGGGRWGGYAGRWMLRGLSYRLDLTPAQEKVVAQGLEDVQEAFGKLREAAWGSRPNIASAFKGEQFNQDNLKDVFGKHDAAVEELQRTILVSLSKIHEALDTKQREAFAEILESGFGGGWGQHQHRGGWGGGRWGRGGGYGTHYV